MSATLAQRIYAGELVHLPASAQSLALCDHVLEVLMQSPCGPAARSLQMALGQDAMMAAIGAAQRAVRSDRQALTLAARLVAASGVPLAGLAIDAVRLRAVTPDGHLRPEARAAYTVHRDTWYANSHSQLNWWLPLFDVTPDDSFRIYPAYFARPIPNTSGGFDHAAWMATVGWQTRGKASLTAYPAPLEAPDASACVDVAAAAGSTLVFSAQHLHGTLPNTTNRIRYSIDFRTVSREDDARGAGAPRVDNDSRGSALADYVGAAELVATP